MMIFQSNLLHNSDHEISFHIELIASKWAWKRHPLLTEVLTVMGIPPYLWQMMVRLVILTVQKNTVYFSALFQLSSTGICDAFCKIKCSSTIRGSLASKSNFDQLSYLFQCVVKAPVGPRRTISVWVVDISDNLDLSLFLLTVILCKTEIMVLPSLSQVLARKKINKNKNKIISQML